MKEQTKKNLSLGKELSRSEQKKVLGGTGLCSGKKCANSPNMSCTTSPISSGYCAWVWPASGGVVINCTLNCA